MEAYSKEALGEEIRRLTAANVQLVNDKLNIKVAKTKLEADKAKLINEKNIFVAKREELQAELAEAVANTYHEHTNIYYHRTQQTQSQKTTTVQRDQGDVSRIPHENSLLL